LNFKEAYVQKEKNGDKKTSQEAGNKIAIIRRR
jgi:hypothetical protein